MSKKIRLGYDILSKRAIETESGVNIDEALKGKISVQKVAGTGADSHPDVARPNTEVIYLVKSVSSGSSETYKQWMWTQPADAEGYWECVSDNTDLSDIEAAIENFKSNIDCVYIDPEHGDDTNNGLSKKTAVKYLKRAAEIYVNQFGGHKVTVNVINTHCPENYQDSETWISPGNTSNLFLDEIDYIDEVEILNDNGICVSDIDYQTTPGSYSGQANPNYDLSITSERGVGLYFNVNTIVKRCTVLSNTGDIYITGGYTQSLESLKLVCQNGTLYNGVYPRYNPMLDSDTVYYFDAKYYFSGSTLGGKDATIISRNTLQNGPNPPSGKEANNYPQFLLRGDLTIHAAGSIRNCKDNNAYSSSYVGGKVTIRSIGENTGSLDIWDIQGHCTDGSGSGTSGDPTITSYPDIDIEWSGNVYFGYFIGTNTQRARTTANSIKLKCNKFDALANFDIFSRSDIIFELNDGDMHSYSWSGHLYADGMVKIVSETALQCPHNIHADKVDIISGGIPEYKPITTSPNSGSVYSTTRAFTGSINARITNAIEFFIGTASGYYTSTDYARYSIKCSGDYTDYNYSFQNGNATVSLDVAGAATISNNSSMLVKRLVLRSDYALFTNSGIYVSSFDIKCGKIQVNNGGYINQWYSYGSGGWEIGYKNGSSVNNGGSWTNKFEDRSVIDCESLESLTPALSSGWVRPAYITNDDGSPIKHDIDISIGVLIPYRVYDCSYSGGNEYCSIIGQPFQGTPNSAITGTIGDVMIGNNQFVSEFKHDWFMTQSDANYYEQYSWNGSTISCHFLKEISHNVYIDFNQGSDAYDGLSKETPVRTMRGLAKTCNLLYADPRDSYVLTIHVMSSGNGRYDSTSPNMGISQSLDFYDSVTQQTYNHGLCYNWYAAKYLDDNKATLLPDGWRVPTENDFESLLSAGGNGGINLKVKDWLGNDIYGLNFIKCGTGYGTSWNNSISALVLWTSNEYNTSYDSYGNTFYVGRSSYTGTSYKYAYNPIRLVKTASEGMETGDTGTVTIGGVEYNTVVINGLIWITRNLDYKFTDGTFRDGSVNNTITESSTPQYAYYNYNSSGTYTLPFGYCQYVEIVSEKPFLSIHIDSLNANVCKISGFRNVRLTDPRITMLCVDASEDIYYTCGYRGKYGHGQPEEYSPSILVAKSRNFYGRGFRSAYSTYIEAGEIFNCVSSGYGPGSSATPYFYGSINISAKFITIGEQVALFENMTAVLEASNRIQVNRPPTVRNGTLKLIAHGTETNSFYFQNITGANILIDAKHADVNMQYLNYPYSSSGGTLSVTCKSFYCAQTIYNADVFIDASRTISMANSTIYGDGGTEVTLKSKYIYAPKIYGGTYKIECTSLSSPVIIGNNGYRSGNTYVYVDADRCGGTVFDIQGDRTTDYWLEAHIKDLSGAFVENHMSSSSSAGAYIKKCKGVIDFYTGNDPDNDLADWREDIAPNADFDLIVLNRSKQLVAGTGITISDTGDNVVIAARNDMPLSTVEIPVVIDALDTTHCTASLFLNKYNIITGLTDTITDLEIILPEPAPRSLREVGFEFEPVEGTQLENVTFNDTAETQYLPIMPDEYAYGCVYQGAVINRCVTLVEYGDPVEGLVIDGRTYRTVTMPDGNEWMAENLAAPSFGGVCYNNGDDDSYGLYYTAEEVANISVPGWHVATVNEWTSLAESVDSNYAKLASTDEWITPDMSVTTHGTDDYGFTFCPYAYGYSYMEQQIGWVPIGIFGTMWLSNGNQIGAVGIQLEPNTEELSAMIIAEFPSGSGYLQSVRLVKDTE